MKNYYQVEEVPSTSFSVIRVMNLIFVILDLSFLLYHAMNIEVLRLLLGFHSIVLVPSLLFHVFPKIRHNKIYRTLASMVGYFSIVALMINYILIVRGEGQTALFYFLFLIILTFPGFLIAGSLLILIKFGEKHYTTRFISVPNQYMTCHQLMI